MLTIGLPAVIVVAGVASVPFSLGGSGADAIRTAEVAVTTTIPPSAPTTEADEVFSSADVTTETLPGTLPSTTAPATTSTTSSTTSSTTTTTRPTTTTLATIPDTIPNQPAAPIAPPADPRAAEDQIQLGGISIPKLGVDAPLFEGIRLTTLDNGPGHWPGTAMPGEVGNVVVAAHRTSHGATFRNIDQLVAGDQVFFDVDGGNFEYTVTGTQVVEPTAVWIVDPTDTPTATLFACHPPGSVSQRIVVKLELA